MAASTGPSVTAYKNVVIRTGKQAALLVDRHSRQALHTECSHPAWVIFSSDNLKMCHECRVEVRYDGSYLG